MPPVADQVSAGSAVEPSDQSAPTVNCWLAPADSVTEDGFSTSWLRVGVGSAGATAPEQPIRWVLTTISSK